MLALERCTAPTDEFGKHYTPGEFLPFYVPRAYMPQVDERYTVKMLVDSSLVFGREQPLAKIMDPRTLRAHQRIDHARAAAMTDAVRAKPIIVSADGYVVDGNHRWWAHVKAGSTAIAVFELQQSFEDAINWLNTLPYVYQITPTTRERN